VSEATVPIGPILALSTVLINSEKKREVKLMKKLLTVTAICVAVMLAIVPLASGQEKGGPPAGGPPAGGPPQGGPPGGGPPPGGGAQAEKVFQGQLAKVDAQAKSIDVKGPGGMDMTFDYTDGTQVVGEKNVQGLAGKTGADVRVTYRDAGGKHIATKIETAEKGEKGGKDK